MLDFESFLIAISLIIEFHHLLNGQDPVRGHLVGAMQTVRHSSTVRLYLTLYLCFPPSSFFFFYLLSPSFFSSPLLSSFPFLPSFLKPSPTLSAKLPPFLWPFCLSYLHPAPALQFLKDVQLFNRLLYNEVCVVGEYNEGKHTTNRMITLREKLV